jgi:uncharacterized protein (TIGR02996 family)
LTRAVVLSLLSDIKTQPDKDGLRLVLADYLDDHGDDADRARAELIRAQVGPGAAHADSQALCRKLQQQFGDRWLGPVRPWVSHWATQRGLVTAQVACEAFRSQGLRAHAESEAWAWVDCVEVRGDHALPRGLAVSPLLACLNGVKFIAFHHYAVELLEELASAEWLVSIRRLDLSRLGLGGSAWASLFPSHLKALSALDLSSNSLSTPWLSHAGKADWAKRLRLLNCRDCGLADVDAVALAEGESLSGLKELDLRDNRIGNAGALALASSPHLSGLESLSLWGNPISQAGWEALRRRFGARVHGAPVVE